MIAIAIGALAHQIIARRRGNRIVVERRVKPPHVARKEESERLRRRTGEFHLDKGTAQHMPRIVKPAAHPRHRRKPFLAGHSAHLPERSLHVALVVERQGRAVLGKSLAVGVLGILIMALGRIVEQQPQQIGGGRGGENVPLESFAGEPRQPAGMIDVAVGQHHRIDR